MTTVYRSKIDAWLLVVLTLAMVVSLFAAGMLLADPSATNCAFAAFLVLTGVGLPLWLLLGTRYTLGQGQLLVRSGPFKWRIRLADITGITPTSNPVSSPALSLDRLRVEYGKGRSLMISPRDKERFVRDVEVASHGRVG